MPDQRPGIEVGAALQEQIGKHEFPHDGGEATAIFRYQRFFLVQCADIGHVGGDQGRLARLQHHQHSFKQAWRQLLRQTLAHALALAFAAQQPGQLPRPGAAQLRQHQVRVRQRRAGDELAKCLPGCAMRLARRQLRRRQRRRAWQQVCQLRAQAAFNPLLQQAFQQRFRQFTEIQFDPFEHQQRFALRVLLQQARQQRGQALAAKDADALQHRPALRHGLDVKLEADLADVARRTVHGASVMRYSELASASAAAGTPLPAVSACVHAACRS